VQYIEVLTEYEPGHLPAVFLAGGITGCPDWQQEIVDWLADLPLVFLNPRRADFPINDPAAAPLQIEWEFRHLRKASAILFWFPEETLCPISLYELGAWSVYRDERGIRPLFVGVHPGYLRRQDVEIQTRLTRPEIVIHNDLPSLADAVRQWVHSLPLDSDSGQ
jgi:hypothetical protein